ncbi:hypothetical protein EST38_g11746 [Candolleomyces aberdarensis]|uniref:Nephrocystin 3-like N-terminal domain-containing protein n=1 Tax=Candolleomyces aberdarensis TaxID=2316362 RepID=A0A4Q2D449_9AGAR|nr:hypothetical protein EST38_g11746 [Candolleomyces aberdarensis]
MDIARSSRSFFRNAHHFQTGDFHCINAPNATHVTNHPVITSRSTDGWETLMQHTAPNALHNSSARYDAPKCDEDTRVEVTSEIMGWIKDRNSPQRLLCMTGAAGSGKSALQQSIAECCAECNILGAAYFISAADANRNGAFTIVPTIAYQLGLNHPMLKCSIAAAVNHDPLIFNRSLQTQMDVLIVRPFESLRRSEQCDLSTFPYAILIDGLDECNGKPSTNANLRHVNAVTECKAEDRQAELLTAIKNSLLNSDLPFRIFIASRPEWAIRTALGTGGYLNELAYHLRLSDHYDATEDMRRYLRRRFESIGLSNGEPHWFTEGNIETLVRAASGQFIYVATVYKYVSARRASPVDRLKTVLNWTPNDGQVTRPFEALDTLYTNILLSAKEAYEAVDTHSGRDFLLLFRILLLEVVGLLDRDIPRTILHLESNGLEILTSDLHSLVHLVEERSDFTYLTTYHKSLGDFMNQESRARELFVPEARAYTHLAKCCMRYIIESPVLEFQQAPSKDRLFLEDCLAWAIEKLARFLACAVTIDDEIVDFTRKGGWRKIDTALPSGKNIIFEQWKEDSDWVKRLSGIADDLKTREPEAAAIMSISLNAHKLSCCLLLDREITVVP